MPGIEEADETDEQKKPAQENDKYASYGPGTFYLVTLLQMRYDTF